MPRVTRLEATRRDTAAVELDGAHWRELPVEAVVRAGLKEGVEIDRGRLRTLARERRRSRALTAAKRALAPRDLSSAELEDRLARRRIRPADRAEAVTALRRAGYVDDARFATERARVLAERSAGDRLIRADLESRGVAPDLVESALATLSGELERAGRVVELRGPGVETARFLARRGFGGETIEAVMPLDVETTPE